MALRIYDTLTRQKREFAPLQAGQVRMYVCGPTVYAKAHVGHAMSAVVFDVIRRYLEHRGHTVTHVMNYTDVEDKILLRARELGVDPRQLAEGYIQEYDTHLRELHVLPASRTPRASQEIPSILEMIQKLVDRGAAYPVDGDVYFRVATDPEYGKLSGRKPEEMRAGARIEVDERKENPADFALWKAAKPGEPSWPSPWGPGRPGWHIECSAMILRHLGEQIDIHGGGNDLIFPHHENEIAQSETYTGKPFARFWIHNGMLQFSDEKMSKSLGNVVTVEDFLQRHEGDALRMLVLNSGYRKPLAFSEEAVAQAEANVERLRSAIRAKGREGGGASPETAGEISRAVAEARRGFEEAMDDDFNTPTALRHLFGLARAIQKGQEVGASADGIGRAKAELHDLTSVLGLRLVERAVVSPSKLLLAYSEFLRAWAQGWVKRKELDHQELEMLRNQLIHYGENLMKSLGDLRGAAGEGVDSERLVAVLDALRTNVALNSPGLVSESGEIIAEVAEESSGQITIRLADLDMFRPLIKDMVDFRTESRERGQFPVADVIRIALGSSGVVVQDTDVGSAWYVAAGATDSEA